MKKIILIILLALALSASIKLDYIEVFTCDKCVMVNETTKFCYCTAWGTSCGNDCDQDYFHWSRWEGVYQYYFMCHGWKMYAPLVVGDPSRLLIDRQEVER